MLAWFHLYAAAAASGFSLKGNRGDDLGVAKPIALAYLKDESRHV